MVNSAMVMSLRSVGIGLLSAVPILAAQRPRLERTPRRYNGHSRTRSAEANAWTLLTQVARAGARRHRPPRREAAAAHAAPGEQGQLGALRQALTLTGRPTPWKQARRTRSAFRTCLLYTSPSPR